VLLEDSIANLIRLLCISPLSSAFDAFHFVRLFFLVEVVKVTLCLIVFHLLPPRTTPADAAAAPVSHEDQFFLTFVGFIKTVCLIHSLAALFLLLMFMLTVMIK